MIQTQGITKSFGNLQVLKGIDLTINKGEVVAIVGPSGAGKQRCSRLSGHWIRPTTVNYLLTKQKRANFPKKNWLPSVIRISALYFSSTSYYRNLQRWKT